MSPFAHLPERGNSLSCPKLTSSHRVSLIPLQSWPLAEKKVLYDRIMQRWGLGRAGVATEGSSAPKREAGRSRWKDEEFIMCREILKNRKVTSFLSSRTRADWRRVDCNSCGCLKEQERAWGCFCTKPEHRYSFSFRDWSKDRMSWRSWIKEGKLGRI